MWMESRNPVLGRPEFGTDGGILVKRLGDAVGQLGWRYEVRGKPRRGLLEWGKVPGLGSDQGAEEPGVPGSLAQRLFREQPRPKLQVFQERAFRFQVWPALSLCPGAPAGPARIGRHGTGPRRLAHRYWRTFRDKFSRAGEIVEIMRGTLLVHCLDCPHSPMRPCHTESCGSLALQIKTHSRVQTMPC